MKTRITTDTATIVLFDPACLKHRLRDDADWWSIARDELAEVNAGNAAFLNIGADGTYDVEVVDSFEQPAIDVVVKNVSGRFFLGAGEEVSSAGLEPDATRGGTFIDVAPGTYVVRAFMASENLIKLSLAPITAVPRNAFRDVVRLTA